MEEISFSLSGRGGRRVSKCEGKTIRVLLVDDCAMIREALAGLLEAEPDISVVGAVDEGRAAVDEAAKSRPGIVVLDPNTKPAGGASMISAILAASPRTRVVAFTSSNYKDPAYVSAAMRAGASAYLLRCVSRDEFVHALRAVHQGGGFLQPEVTGLLIRSLIPRRRGAKGRRWALSQRELQILECLTEGMTNKDIARALAISDQTVKTHLKQLFKKLEVTDRTAAVVLALRSHWIT